MTPGSVLVEQRGIECPLLPGSWRTEEGREKWAGAGLGEVACLSLPLPGASWRGWQAGWVEGNRAVIRAFALPPVIWEMDCLSGGQRSQHREATSEKSRWQGQLAGASPGRFCVVCKAPRGEGGVTESF